VELIHNISILLSLVLPYLFCKILKKVKILKPKKNIAGTYIIIYWSLLFLTPFIDNILYNVYKINTAFSFIIGMSTGLFMLLVTLLYLLLSSCNKTEVQKPIN